MKISLIENGLDSLQKGLAHLKAYDELNDSGAKDAARFSTLKDAILCIQHGVEILFKYLLKNNNEILLFSEVNLKLKEAFRNRRDGQIKELFEAEGLHTVTFRESIERVNDICGIAVEDRLKRKLLKVEGWRNSIIHSAVVLDEHEVSHVLPNIMADLDSFFGKAIGDPYLNGQGRHELERAYRLFIATRGQHDDSIKAKVVERLIAALKENKIKNVTSPGAFMIEDAAIGFAILQKVQGDGIIYGCDMRNLHCSGNSLVTDLSKSNVMNIYCEDNNADYQLNFGGMVVYVPSVGNSISPLIFIYSKGLTAKGRNPNTYENNGFETQAGIFLLDDDTEIWDKDSYYDFLREEENAELSTTSRSIVRYLSKGCACFLNVQLLQHGETRDLMYSGQFDNIDNLYKTFLAHAINN